MRLAPLLAITAAAAFTITACGDDEPTANDAAEAAAPSAGGGGGDGEAITVEIGEFMFEPTPIEVSVGDSVVWENVHNQPHTSSGNGDQTWDTANIQPGDTSDPVVFDEAGTFTYICGLHPFMEGTVEVST